MAKFNSFLKIFSYSLAIIGTTIGAGFVSGKEISNFFNVYGNWAYLMAIIMGIVYFFMLKFFFACSTHNPLENNKTVDYLIIFTQFISLSAMIAGLYSVLTNYFGTQILFYVLTVICFIIILCGLKGLTNTNMILIPFLLVFVLYVGISSLVGKTEFGIETISTTPTKIIFNIFLYIGLDLFSCYPISLVLGKNTTKKERNIIALIVGIVISVLILCYFFSILEKGTNYAYFDLPILNYTIDHFDNLYIFACIVISIGIVTTLLSDGFVITEMIGKHLPKAKFLTFLTLFCLAFIISFFGFSFIVEYLYPVIGILGLMILSILFVKYHKSRKM